MEGRCRAVTEKKPCKELDGGGQSDETLPLRMPSSEMNGVVRWPALQPVLVYEWKKVSVLGLE